MSPKNQIWHIRAKIPNYFSACRGDREKCLLHERVKEPRDGVQGWDSRDRAERLKCRIWVRTANHKEIRALAHEWEQKTERLYLERPKFPSPHTACYELNPVLLIGGKRTSQIKMSSTSCVFQCAVPSPGAQALLSSKAFWAQSSYFFWLKTVFFCSVSPKIWHNDLFKAVLTFKTSPLQ